jgi:hypothetical protein
MRVLLFFQGVYYLITGIWPLVSLDTFEAVTGPKTDDWLVQTVGVLASVIGAALLLGAVRSPPVRETVALSTLSAIAFTGVDVTFVGLRVISRIYLVDAAIQIAVLLTTVIIYARAGWSHRSHSTTDSRVSRKQ